jgi:2-methylcitrate dehydratase PrpD
VEVEYPLGHRRRRAEALPYLEEKCRAGLASRLPAQQVEAIMALFADRSRLEHMPVEEFMGLFVA